METVNAMGGKAEGIAGDDSTMIRVNKFRPAITNGAGEIADIDLGFVGEVKCISSEPLYSSLDRGALPIIATLGLGDDGQTYNVNADEVAGELAATLSAEKLVFLSNVKGVMKDPEDEESLISSLKVSMVEDLMKKGIIVVEGSTGEFTGVGMRGGTIFCYGSLGKRVGSFMERGSIVSYTPPSLLPTFTRNATYNPTWLRVFLLNLKKTPHGIPIKEEHVEGLYIRYNGDISELGKGEIFVFQGTG